MDNKTRPGRNQSTFLHPITYLSLHRHQVHNILKATTRPESWTPYVGARETEYFAECQFEAKRRHGPPHGLGCSNWITSTHVNHHAQLTNIAKQKEPGELLEAPKQSLSMEEKTRISNLAMQTAAKLFVLCCPRTMPQTVVNQSMTLTLRRYRNWCSAKQNVPREEEGYQDADSEPESEKYDEDRAHMNSCSRWFGPDPSSGSLAPLTSERGSPWRARVSGSLAPLSSEHGSPPRPRALALARTWMRRSAILRMTLSVSMTSFHRRRRRARQVR